MPQDKEEYGVTNAKAQIQRRASFMVMESPETVLEWMKQNIRREPTERLYEALAVAIKMREE